MTYVALLRGINVGGNHKVEMKRLRALFEELGFSHVQTYINSGNVIFCDDRHSQKELEPLLESAIEREFKFPVKVLVREQAAIKRICQTLPSTWTNDATMKCDVLFLAQSLDTPNVLTQLPPKKEFEDLLYVPGAVLWRVDRENVTKSNLIKLVGSQLYTQMTVRNCNTVRKLSQLTDALAKK